MILDCLLPPPPAHWDASREAAAHAKVAPTVASMLEPVGAAFAGRLRRHRHKRTLMDDHAMYSMLEDDDVEDNVQDEEPESKKLLRSDPKDWKTLDHYAVMGLSALRWRANDDDIKRAYRRKVLKHHPDKKAAEGSTDDKFFKCIQRSWELLTNPKKRRQWDSCDPGISDALPPADDPRDFFELYSQIFENESRFSKAKNPPKLGSLESTRKEVDHFYKFWFEFESWRSFEFRDEEDAEASAGGGRDEKRYLERKNKSQRQKLKKEDNARLNRLTDQAFSLDPRILMFKKQEKEAKEIKKRERDLVSRAGEIEAARIAEEERVIAEAQQALEAEKLANEKKDREAHKNAVRKEKKAIKRMLRDNSNFLSPGAAPDAVILQLQMLETILENNNVEQLEAFRIKLDEAFESGVHTLCLVFDEEHMNVVERKSMTTEQAAQSQKAKPAAAAAKSSPWTTKETAMLIKAVNSIPGGTNDRWGVIAAYIREHAESGIIRSPKECIAHSKSLKTAPATQRADLQAHAKVAKPVQLNNVASERIEPLQQSKQNTPAVAPAEKQVPKEGVPTMLLPANSNWTIAQQLELEAGLRSHPASKFSAKPAERWETIAQGVQGKSAKDVKTRVKALADLVKKGKK